MSNKITAGEDTSLSQFYRLLDESSDVLEVPKEESKTKQSITEKSSSPKKKKAAIARKEATSRIEVPFHIATKLQEIKLKLRLQGKLETNGSILDEALSLFEKKRLPEV